MCVLVPGSQLSDGLYVTLRVWKPSRLPNCGEWHNEPTDEESRGWAGVAIDSVVGPACVGRDTGLSGSVCACRMLSKMLSSSHQPRTYI